MSALVLPDPSDSVRRDKPPGAVLAWEAPVSIPTYLPLPPDKNPMFLDRRVYQGSSGRVYPLPFIDRISNTPVDRQWRAIHIENRYVRLMILPELGGRIHLGLDKTNGYDLFYRQNVIKPALVGLAGPWISGGVEFNWPQHHRPSTFMPVDTHIEEHDDGGVTVWCSEHEPMNRMKGMHGICLRPDSARIELKVRLFNRTDLPQTFLWWANVAARVHQHYQAFFPPDVHYVADHAKRAMSTFPLCQGTYYGIDYGARARMPPAPDPMCRFPPTGAYPPNDLSWYANIPVPTSYMVIGSKEDFFGGYDHQAQAGFVHIADHHVSPGKKLWTWGNHPFGYAWDRHLTDPDKAGEPPAPYIELMAGVYTDNQPDFSWLMPGEVRAWSQYWYPISRIGPVQAANENAALSFTELKHENPNDREGPARIRIGLVVTQPTKDLYLAVRRDGEIVLEKTGLQLAPGEALVESCAIPPGARFTDLQVSAEIRGESPWTRLIAYRPLEPRATENPPPAREPVTAEQVSSVEDLYLIGLHLEQYRHATRKPEDYWREALRRDPADSRCNNALGLWHLKRGEFETAVGHFQKAIETLTKHNPNPRDGEAHYNLGLAWRGIGRDEDAYDAFAKAAWNQATQPAALLAMARVRCRQHRWHEARACLDSILQPANFTKFILHGLINRSVESDPADPVDPGGLLRTALMMDPHNELARFLVHGEAPFDLQTRLDIALDLAGGGFFQEAIALLESSPPSTANPPTVNFQSPVIDSPLPAYYTAYFHERLNQPDAAREARVAAAAASPDYCFPHRVEEITILQEALEKNPDDARAPYYLGNLLYDKGRRQEAIPLWEMAVQRDRSFPTAWRNLGIGYFNVLKDPLAAQGAYQRAFKNSFTQDADGNLLGGDARILYERDQLWRCVRRTPRERLEQLEQYLELVGQRDDLMLEFCALLNQVQEHETALEFLKSRAFQPWEGGEGMALAQWVRTHVALGRRTLWLAPGGGGSPAEARRLFEAGLHPPENLGEAFHPLQNNSELHYWAGQACKTIHQRGGSAADLAAAEAHFRAAAGYAGDFQHMAVTAWSEMTFYSAMALRELGKEAECGRLLAGMLQYSQDLAAQTARIDYFATSLPTMLLFAEDPGEAQLQRARLLEALARYGLRETSAARRLLGDILQSDPNHALAADMLVALDWSL